MIPPKPTEILDAEARLLICLDHFAEVLALALALRNASTSLRQSRREFREQGRCRRRLSRRLQPRRSIAARLRWQPSRQALAAAC